MRIAGIALLLAVAVILSSCAGKKTDTTGSIETKSVKYTVGVSLLTKEHAFYQELEAAMKEQAAKDGIKLQIQSAEMDLPAQTSQVENFIAQKVDAIIVCPVDTKSIAGAIKKANIEKIPVFTADIAAEGGDVVSHIASDNVAGGKLAGEYMVRLLSGKGKVVIVNHPVVKSVQDRVKGFKDALKGSQIQVVADQPGEGQRDKSMQVAETLLQKYPDLNGIFAINDSTALGCLSAVKATGRDKKVVIVGYDGDPEARNAISAGEALKADAVQYPAEIGETTIETVAKYLNGDKNVPKTIPVKVGIIDKETLAKEKASN